MEPSFQMQRPYFLTLVFCVFLASTGNAAPARLALVIGNDAYALQPLTSAVNDARAMSSSLRELGFDVRLTENLNRLQMRSALTVFIAEVKEREAISLIYFAGHGLQSRLARGRL